MKKSLLTFAAVAVIFTACNQGSKPAETTPTDSTAATEAPADQPAASADGVITLNAGDDMKYDLSEIIVKEGQTIKLTLNHTGKMAVTAMGHNFVLLKSGVALDEFATAAIGAKDNDYIPKDKANDVIAHTKTIGGGESVTIEFPAPAKGSYEFLCSFPGHSAMMRGNFIVQ
ncbi:MAG: azurin [Bacteroidia bacterium]|nr:azurin [Bacteroidia bacterium]MCC6769541.1 azurin [Bacteroidia bacterium]